MCLEPDQRPNSFFCAGPPWPGEALDSSCYAASVTLKIHNKGIVAGTCGMVLCVVLSLKENVYLLSLGERLTGRGREDVRVRMPNGTHLYYMP